VEQIQTEIPSTPVIFLSVTPAAMFLPYPPLRSQPGFDGWVKGGRRDSIGSRSNPKAGILAKWVEIAPRVPRGIHGFGHLA
jgi:hypothetical protein